MISLLTDAADLAGISGSWVTQVQGRSTRVYGQVVAKNGDGDLHVVPMNDILEDVKCVLDAEKASLHMHSSIIAERKSSDAELHSTEQNDHGPITETNEDEILRNESANLQSPSSDKDPDWTLTGATRTTVLKGNDNVQRASEYFFNEVSALTQANVDHQGFISVEKLLEWMRAAPMPNSSPQQAGDDDKTTNFSLLLHAAYSEKTNSLPVLPLSIASDGQRCSLLVFSILFDLNLGHLVDSFNRAGLHDIKLPIPLSKLKDSLQSIPDGGLVAEKFFARQWAFCPAHFSLHMDEHFSKDRILPICRTKEISSGGTARVRQIVVQEEFVDHKLRKELEGDEYAVYTDREFGPVSKT